MGSMTSMEFCQLSMYMCLWFLRFWEVNFWPWFPFVNAALVENGKFMLAARKFRRTTSTDYVISLNADDMSRGSNTYLGKLR